MKASGKMLAAFSRQKKVWEVMLVPVVVVCAGGAGVVLVVVLVVVIFMPNFAGMAAVDAFLWDDDDVDDMVEEGKLKR